MLVRFALSTDCFACSTMVTRRALQVWKRHGVLYYSQAALREAPPNLRNMWERGLLNATHVEVTADDLALDVPLTRETVSLLAPLVELLCVGDAQADLLGMEPNDVSLPSGSLPLEAARIDFIDQSRCIARVARLAEAPIAAGTSVRKVWRERVLPVADQAVRATIIDRFAMERVQRYGAESGLFRFLQFAKGSSRLKYVKILTETRASSGAELQNLLQESGGSLPEVDLFLVDPGTWRRTTADRWIQLDRFVFEIGHGLEVFEGEKVERLNTFSFKAASLDHDQVAIDLQGKSRAGFELRNGTVRGWMKP